MVVSTINMTDEDRLWELYLHTLSGYHAKPGANTRTSIYISVQALSAAKGALEVWERNKND